MLILLDSHNLIGLVIVSDVEERNVNSGTVLEEHSICSFAHVDLYALQSISTLFFYFLIILFRCF